MLSAHGLRAYVWHDYAVNCWEGGELLFGGARVALADDDWDDARKLYSIPLPEIGGAWDEVDDSERQETPAYDTFFPNGISLLRALVKWFAVAGFIAYFAIPVLLTLSDLSKNLVSSSELLQVVKEGVIDVVESAALGALISLFLWLGFRILLLTKRSRRSRQVVGALGFFFGYPHVTIIALLSYLWSFGDDED